MIDHIGHILRLMWITWLNNATLGLDIDFLAVLAGFFALKAIGFLNGKVNLLRRQIRYQPFNWLRLDVQ